MATAGLAARGAVAPALPASGSLSFLVRACAVVVVWFALANAIGSVIVGRWQDTLAGLVVGAATAALGALIAVARPANPIGWIYMISGAAGTLLVAADGDRFALLGAQHQSAALAVLSGTLWPLTFPLLCAAMLWFPRGRLDRGTRLLAVPMLGVIAAIMVRNTVGQWPGAEHGGMRNPLALPLPNLPNLNAAVPVLSLACVLSLCLRYRTFDVVERMQARWVLWAAVMASAATGIAVAATAFGPLPDWAEGTVTTPAVLLIPAAVAVGVLRHQLFDVDVLLNRTLLYLTVSAVLIVTYLGAVTLAGLLVGSSAALPPLVAGLGVALAFHPFRVRAQAFADRRLFGDRDEALRALAEVSASAGSPAVLVGAVAKALRLHHLRLDLVDASGDLREIVCMGEQRGAAVLDFPITRGDRQLGRLVVATRSAKERLRGEELVLLGAVAGQLAIATENEQLATEVRRSLRRTVHVAEDERRRLRRDLHDGLGARLTALGYRIEAGRTAPVPAREAILTGLKADLGEAVAEVRRVIENLRPAALDDLGLVPSVRAAAAKLLADAGIAFEDQLQPPSGHIDAATEVAAYRIAIEAVTNVARHSAATRCLLRLRQIDGLEIVCEDDGTGIPADHRVGVGLTSMTERAVQLGGHLDIRPPDGHGTLIRAVLPVSEESR